MQGFCILRRMFTSPARLRRHATTTCLTFLVSIVAAPCAFAAEEFFAAQLNDANVRGHLTGGPDAVGGIGDWAISNGTLCAVVADPSHEGYILPSGGSLIDLGYCNRDDDQWANLELLSNLARSGAMAWDAVAAEQSDGEARIVTIAERNGVMFQTSYVLDATDPTRLLVRTRLDRVTEGERVFAISDVSIHNLGTLRPFMLSRSGHSEGFKHSSTGSASVSELMSAIVPVKSVTLVGPGGGAVPISYTLRILSSRHVRQDGSEREVPTFALSTETLTMLATFVRPYWIGDGDSINVFKLAQSLFMDLDVGEALVFEREIRVEQRIDGRESTDSGYANGATVRGQLDSASSRVHAFDAEGSALAFVAPEADGSFALRLPPAIHTLEIRGEGARKVTLPVEVANADLDLGVIEMPAAARVTFPADLAPARVVFRGVGETPDPVFGDDMTGFASSGREILAHLASHDVSLGGFGADPASVWIAPGQYRVYATRGPEFGLTETEFSVAAGEVHALDLAAPLRVVETPGWITADLHIHSAPSDDSTVPMRDRLASFLAEGGEVLVSTDHDHVSDFSPLIEELGLRDRIRSVVGLEVTGVVTTPNVPFSVGHHNVFPLPHRPTLHRAGALQSENVRLREIIGEARALPGKRLVQLNHARSTASEGGAADEGGTFFDHLSVGKRFDPSLAIDSENNRSLLEADGSTGIRDIDFDVMELLNSGSMERYYKLRADWFSLLRQGYPKTGTGNSDTHSLYRAPAVPRNYVRMDDDTPRGFEEAKFVDSIGRGALWITTGPILDVHLGDAAAGDTVLGNEATLRVGVRAAPWVPVSELNIFVNGELTEQRSIDAPVDLEIPLRFESDSFVVVEVLGPASGTYRELLPEFQPMAVTNAIFVDADGDGAWSAPGL